MLDLLEQRSAALMDILPAGIAAKLRAIGTGMKYNDAQLIHSRGDKKPGLSIVESGAARIGTVGRDGSFLTISILGPGQSFGEHTLFAQLPRTHDVSAVGDTRVLQIEAAPFQRLFDAEPELARALLVTSLTRSYGLLEMVDDMRRLSLPVRLAKFLMSIVPADKAGQNLVDLACRQSELAFALGVSRVSLGKTLKRLEADGFLKTGYGRITLIDPPRLSGWVDAQRQTTALTPT